MAPRVGILGFQGCIEPHEEILATLGASTVRVTSPHDLTQIDRLILPGGESTTMLRFIKRFEMVPALQEFARHHPVWGICAGAILAARQVHNPHIEIFTAVSSILLLPSCKLAVRRPLFERTLLEPPSWRPCHQLKRAPYQPLRAHSLVNRSLYRRAISGPARSILS